MTTDAAAKSISEPTWIKSSYSGNEGGACVEVAVSHDAVHVRDSKDKQGPQLTVTPEIWARFVKFAAGL